MVVEHARKTRSPVGDRVWSEPLLCGVRLALLRRLSSREALPNFRHGGSLALDYLKDSAQGSCSGMHVAQGDRERYFLVHKT